MSKLNIPIYRAKKIDSDEWVEGFYSQGVSRDKETRFAITNIIMLKEIDPSTLAIHFPNMIDSEGTKIFASLSEDGKGGDILSAESRKSFVPFFEGGNCYILDDGFKWIFNNFLTIEATRCKVTGIQE